MVSSCPSDGSVTWLTGDCGIDFTIAFEDYILLLIPAACLLLLTPLRLRTIWSRTIKVVTPTILQLVKTLSALTFVGLSFACLVANCTRAGVARSAEIPAAVVAFLASVAAFVLSHWEHVRSIRPSKLLQLYLIVALVVQAVHLRTTWTRHNDIVLQVLGIGQVISCAVFLAAESVGKERILIAKQHRSPQDVNDLFSERLFWWLNTLFKRGYRSLLVPGDLGETDEDLSSPETDRRFRLTWLKYYHRDPKVSLVRIVFVALSYDIIFPIIPRTLLLAVNFAQPYLIMKFVQYLERPAESGTEEGIFLVLATALIYTAIATVQSWYWQSVDRFQVKLRGCLTTALHDKALRSRPDAVSSPLTLMNVDVERILMGLRNSHEYWATTISIGIALGLLYGQVGIVFLAPLVLLVVLISASALNGTAVGPKQKAWFSATQDRISYITDVVASMKNVKLLGISPSVLRMGNELRDKEVDAQRSIRKALMLNLLISLTVFQLSALVLYGAYAIKTHLDGEPLTNTRLFTSLSILKLFTSPLLITIQNIPGTMQSISSLQRLKDYLATEDFEDKRCVNDKGGIMNAYDTTGGLLAPDEKCIARMAKVSCGYTSDVVTLTDVSCDFRVRSLNMVVGRVGAGKSTLLKTLIGETKIFEGSVSVSTEDAAFCDQAPWLWNASIKDNICGHLPYDESWFSRVTWACGLHDDFNQLQQGTNTHVGSNGTSLSGGQKNRISLARAIYSRKRLVVLDDVLSGLDTRTERLVFQRVLGPAGLFNKMNCTVIFATHAVGWLRSADNLVVVDKGRVVFQGPAVYAPAPYSVTPDSPKVSQLPHEEHSEHECIEEFPDDLNVPPTPSSRGSDMRVYKQYFSSFGPPKTIIYFFFCAMYGGGNTIHSLWLKWWAAANATTSYELGKYAGTFAAITGLNVLNFTAFIWFAMMILLPRSSRYLHTKQWVALVQVAYATWGTKDTGSIVNRFSQDISIIDGQLNMMFINFTSTCFATIASVGLLIVATNFIAAAVPFLLVIFWAIQRVYLRTSKQLRVMDLEAKAPLCTNFLETVSGVVTINSYGWSQAYREKNAELLGKSQVPFYLLASIQNWLSLVLNLVVAGLATVVMAIAVRLRSSVDAGYIGLALIGIMDLGEMCELLVVSWTGLETSLGAIARLIEFIDDMPQEEQGKLTPSLGWLSEGKIEISNLTASYAEAAEPALKDVNLEIKPGEKVAICGRTGSGKSSLASALFGLLHVQEGSIKIDGANITEVSQDLLRSKMVALPQDPYFTPGTVRDNLALGRLSAFDVSDAAMVDALDQVGLLVKFDALATSSGDTWLSALDVKLNPFDMLTRGQMQLFAMARAMLSPGQIVLVDEATSGLDHVSEDLVQKLLRQEFAGRTIVAIAHHLRTIIDFDTVIVMDNGRIAEMGNPNDLKDKQGSLFQDLLRAAEQ